MVRSCMLLVFLFCLVPSITSAQIQSQFLFNGQNAEVLKGEKEISITTHETVQVPSTCTRQVPIGEREVCRNETRYRQECSWIPASERCWNDTDRVCRTVPRTRQECSTTPSRQVCTPRPSRQVCTERPTRQVCTTRPDGRQHCTTVGGGQHCTTVGGGQDCHTVPGERQCRTVSYNDTQCENVIRRRCETVPGRNECRQIAYSEPVCGPEMQYRTESYACTKPQTVSKVTKKMVKAETSVQIITNGIVEEFPVSVTIEPKTQDYSAVHMHAKLLKEPKAFVVLQKSDVKVASVTEKEVILKGSVILEVLSQEMLPMSLPAEVISATISEDTKKLVLVFEGSLSALGSVDLKITHNTLLTSKKTIAELQADYPSSKVEVGVVGDKAALSIDLSDAIKSALKKKNMKLRLSLTSALNLQGELMNTTKPETTKLFDGKFVELK